MTALSVPAALANPILVYTGNSPLNEGYTLFGTAAGDPVVESAVLPADLSQYDCVVLPVNCHSSSTRARRRPSPRTWLRAGRLFAFGDGAVLNSRPATRR